MTFYYYFESETGPKRRMTDACMNEGSNDDDHLASWQDNGRRKTTFDGRYVLCNLLLVVASYLIEYRILSYLVII